MSREALFPDAHRQGMATRIAQAWDLSWPLPIPRFAMRCPRCCFPEAPLVIKDWKFHVRKDTGSKAPWRVDVRLKCMDCSIVLIFGVALDETTYEAARRAIPASLFRGWIHWREGKRVLAKAGFFDT